jgi:tetrapyrrole methylase family protein/MazG family protein
MTDRAKKLLTKERYDINDLLEIMSILRSDDGCPWDREQTHESIRKNFIEETYEVVEAIDNADSALMSEELGDVLLQIVFHAKMCEEDGEFVFDDVCNDVCSKLIVRHPHIFGDVEADNAEKVLVNWEKIKQETKKRESTYEILDGIAKSLPSLMRAQKIAKKAAKANVYTMPDEKMDKDEIAKKLFDLCALAEKNGYDAEEILAKYCDGFVEKQK